MTTFNKFLGLTVATLIFIAGGCDTGNDAQFRNQPALKDYDETRMAHPMVGQGGELDMIVFAGNGESDDPASYAFINLDGGASCDGANCTVSTASTCLDVWFGRDVVAQQDMLDDFVADSQDRFGVNIANPASYFILFYEAREDVGIRAMAMSGFGVPAEGYPVHDCGIQAIPIDGISVPLVHGSYLIEAEANPGQPWEIILDYKLHDYLIQSVGKDGSPISTGFYDISTIYGDGKAVFNTASKCDGEVNYQYQTCSGHTSHWVRNVMTFSDRDGL